MLRDFEAEGVDIPEKQSYDQRPSISSSKIGSFLPRFACSLSWRESTSSMTPLSQRKERQSSPDEHLHYGKFQRVREHLDICIFACF